MKTLIRKAATLACTAMAMLTAPRAQANNIQVTNPTLTNGTGGNATIQFDLSWENSWRGGGVSNWDAAWVFVKYYSGNAWHHAYLNNSGHVPASGSQIDVGLLSPGTAYNVGSNPVVGVFAYRSADGSGNLTLTGTQLSWNYGAQGLAFNDITKVQVFAIEMVFAPEGAFTFGGIGYGNPPTIVLSGVGFRAFYTMKYEESAQSCVDFLNTISLAEQIKLANLIGDPTTLVVGAKVWKSVWPASASTNIRVQSTGMAPNTPASYGCDANNNGVYGESDDGGDRSEWMYRKFYFAYLDWCGLRPMSTLEFEKACRGTLPPVANDYPWGTSEINTTPYTLTNVATPSEGIASGYSSTLGNANYLGMGLDFTRVGIFAANPANTGRVTAGASYYGVMELGGSLLECTLPYSSNDAIHGDGEVSLPNGNGLINDWFDQIDWIPTGPNSFGYYAAEGEFRGGSFLSTSEYLRVGNHNYAIYSTEFNIASGGHGVRTAP